MKLDYVERSWGLELSLTPETIEETAQLFRFSNNIKSEKPDVFMSFSDKPYCSVVLKKVSDSKQINYVKRKK